MGRPSICFDRANQSLCDVEIIAGTGDDGNGQTPPILATKVFLYDISNKWKELIQSASKPFPLSLTTGAEFVKDKIFIPQILREIMENIIDFVYAGHRNEIQPLPLDDENVGKYFEAAKFLEMEEIEAECLNYFDSKIITMENFPVLFKWSSTFGNEAIQPKMRAFLTQNSQQIPEIMRRCKNELKIPEAEIALVLIDWISFCSSGGKNCDWNVEQIIPQFSNTNEKMKLLAAFHDSDDPETKNSAFRLLLNLCKNQDRDSDLGKKTPPATGKAPPPPKSKRKSVSFSCAPSKVIPSKSGPSSNLNSSGCQEPSTSKFSASPAKKLRIEKDSTGSNLKTVFVELEREEPQKPQEQEQKKQIENDSDSDDSSSSSSSSCSSSSSSSSWSTLHASTTQKKRKFNKKKKLAQNSAAQGKIYFLLKNQNSPGGFHFWSFNLKTKRLDQEAQLPPSFGDRRNLAMIYWKNIIYFMGGKSSESKTTTKQVDAFDLNCQEWTKTEMLDPRSDFGACVLNGNIYAVGGRKLEENPRGGKSVELGINTVEMLPLASRESSVGDDSPKWEEVDCMEEVECMESVRAHAGILTLGRKIYAIGGEVWNRKLGGKMMNASDLCEVFDPKILLPKYQWNPIAPMEHKRLGLAAVATTDPNRIYALGGTVQSPATKKSAISLDTVEIYNPDAKSWKNGPPMKKRRKFFSAVYFNTCIYALGGDSETQPTMEKFDLRTKKWTLEGDLKKEGNFTTVAFEAF